MSIANTSGLDYQSIIYKYSSKSTSKTTSTSSSYGIIQKSSVVHDFKIKHPDRASHVDQQVRAGKAFLEKNGQDRSVTENMTMEEYQAYIYALIDKIPYDATRPNDTSFISISDRGWEQMRSDPDYEAWILGYLVEDRSVRNPFYAWGNNAGSVISEHFGASIEEHHGESFSKAALNKNKSNDDEEDWWTKRHKRMKKLLKEQVERSIKKNAAQRAAVQEEYTRQHYLSVQRQQSFLRSGTVEAQPELTSESHSASKAAEAYTSILDLFGASVSEP